MGQVLCCRVNEPAEAVDDSAPAPTPELSESTIAIVKATAPVVAENARAITGEFYKMMFNDIPAVKMLFPQSHHGKNQQPMALANAVIAYATHIEDLGKLKGAVEHIAHKHVAYMVQKEQYPIVGEYLLKAIKAVLGDAATDEILDGWGKAYFFLADIFIKAEEELYKNFANRPSGWNRYKDFVIQRKEKESDVITSLYLVPADESEQSSFVSTYYPGQYIGVKMEISEGYTQVRTYSVSDAPGTPYIRISVRREEAPPGESVPHGIISNHIHDKLEVGDVFQVAPGPCGEFILSDEARDSAKPLVFISAGVGQTPLLSMYKTVMGQEGRDITWVHCAKNEAEHGMRGEVDPATAKANVTAKIFYSANGERLGADSLKELIKDPADSYVYYCCRPSLMDSIAEWLGEAGVPKENQFFEYFMPKI